MELSVKVTLERRTGPLCEEGEVFDSMQDELVGSDVYVESAENDEETGFVITSVDLIKGVQGD